MRKLILDYVYEHGFERSDHVFLTQPVGHGDVVEFTWGQVMHQARRIS